ncbi:site-2 protease family protein [uncultured Cohaesibacter sp.]|uniref:site-2 protease family protein n=1 Tax=uncultured Cohaesibacter sp. TaxID=1002546 RepID=UPI00292F1B66|nr:site-2 protease family protein [uncultured Cohaesibacter sp.]
MSSSLALDSLPALRQELEIHKDGTDNAPGENWIIHDPVQHRYFQISDLTMQLVRAWPSCKSPEDLRTSFEAESGIKVDESEITSLIAFLRRNGLTAEDENINWRGLSAKADATHKMHLKQLPQKIFFFKVPLFNPQAFLQTLLPTVESIITRRTALLLGAMLLVGLYMTSRQWEAFLASFPHFMSRHGIMTMLVALVCLKALHELGHAFTAVHYGCRVPAIGIAFMFMTPMLFADVSDAWRIPSRKNRILISAAGLLTELAVAIIALFLWPFLPDGVYRTTAFVFATTGLVSSLLVNLNPLMRFDGYFIFSDWLGIDNLRPRSYAFGRWKLRQWLIGPTLQAPEDVPKDREALLVAYAWMSWGYRLLVYWAFAIFFYTYTFKLLGIVLFALTLWSLLIRPIGKELLQWRSIDKDVVSINRLAFSVLGLSVVFLMFVVPWKSSVDIPAISTAADIIQIYPEHSGKITFVDLSQGEKIDHGKRILSLAAPDLDKEIKLSQIRLAQIKAELARIQTDEKHLEERLILEQELGTIGTKLGHLRGERERLDIYAAPDSSILQIAENLHPGRWVGENDLLAIISQDRKTKLHGYVDEYAVARLKTGQTGLFIPDLAIGKAIKVRLERINLTSSPRLDLPELTTRFGGDVTAEPDEKNHLIPRSAQFLVEFSCLSSDFVPDRMIRGIVNMNARRESLASNSFRHIAQVLIKELGI